MNPKQPQKLQAFILQIIFVCFVILLPADRIYSQETYQNYPMWNPDLPFSERVYDIISRLTLQEKVQQMVNHAPSVDRLGIPAYDWWNEVLHGIARTPYHVTVYPQAIGMAATWNTDALQTMAAYSAMEGRLIYKKAKSENRHHERYMGLTYWTPNINIFRDPRWGRGQETYGEDPVLTGKLGAAFVKGLQGTHDKYLHAAACAKHYAVHSGPEPSRHSDNFNPSPYDLWDTYLPAFKKLITQSRVAGVMCAYNAVDGQPCCASTSLMRDILRNKWGFNGYVTSDCWAIDDFFNYHKTHPDGESASVDAVIHGTDVECGSGVFLALENAVKEGKLPESYIDSAVYRLFLIRMKLGMFDPDDMVPYQNTSLESPASQKHLDFSLKMARESIVLLKNEKNTLPLDKNKMKKIKIALFGPNADNRISPLGNYNGIPPEIITIFDACKEKVGAENVFYDQAINFTNDTMLQYRGIENRCSYDGKRGFYTEYFNNEALEGKAVLTEMVKEIDFYWTDGQKPVDALSPGHFSIRYSTTFIPEKDETLTFEVNGDDGYRLFIDDKEVINAWTRNRWGARQHTLNLSKEKPVNIRLEYRQGEGNASIFLKAGQRVKADFQAIIDRAKDCDYFVFAGGISPQLEGEEMSVPYPGFSGGDRTTILLPEVQSRFLKALTATGKPVIFVMMTGSAIAIPQEDKNVDAILNIWYGGPYAGRAAMDIIFGEISPSGRLPVTFYKGDENLPDFKDYSMENRTYRYFTGTPLYPFGYGLSYSTFNYSDAVVDFDAAQNGKVPVRFTIANTGKYTASEVAQIYISMDKEGIKKPLTALKDFTKIHNLNPGEKERITCWLNKEDFQLTGEDGLPFLPEGNARIYIGGGQPNVLRKTSFTGTETQVSLNHPWLLSK